MDIEKITKIATILANETDTDILLYNGNIDRPFDEQVIDECRNAKRRKNVVLVLCTYGGDPSAGYRIARCLQQKYEKFTVWIGGTCKSAGTLITVGAHEIVMSDHGEMGPLDVQVDKKDEIWEADSGLTVLSAIKALEEKSFDLFESCFLNLKSRSGGRITLKTATEVASKLAIGTIAPIVAQIDPMHVGEVSRAMNIGLDYGTRLSEVSSNTLEDTLQKLANSYPSHGFVIDREEAKDMFEHVRAPNEKECELIDLLGAAARNPSRETIFAYISNSPDEDSDESNNEGNDPQGSEKGAESAANVEKFDTKTSASPQIGGLRQVFGRRNKSKP